MKRSSKVVLLDSVSVVYAGSNRTVLEKISFSISKGMFVAITGPNASGKTTLARLLSGLIPGFYKARVRGVVSVLGVNTLVEQDKLVGRIGYLSQEPFSQILTPFVFEEVALPLILRGCSSRELVEQRVHSTLKSLGGEILVDRSTFELSGGELVRVVLAANIVGNPELLILDEPTAFLDTEGIKDLYRVLNTLKKNGLTIIIATHRPEDLIDLIDLEISLYNGRITYVGKPRKRDTRLKHTFTCHASIKKIDPLECKGDYLARIIGATYTYPRKGFELRNINLCIGRNEKTLIIGPNGSGKTTLLKILSRVYKPTKGSISLNGRAIYVPQDPRLFFTYETPYRELKEHGIPDDEIDVVSSKFGFHEYLFKPVHTLSYGTLRKIAVATGVYGNYDLVLLDEPSAGIDEDSFNELVVMLCGLEKNIVVSTNDPRLVDRLVECFDKIVLLEKGVIKGVYCVN